jgi:hypothetical protein
MESQGEWILMTEITELLSRFYPARIVEATCPRCGTVRVSVVKFSETPIPRQYICPESIVAVVGRIYKSRSGASYTYPNWMGEEVLSPENHGMRKFFLSKLEDIKVIKVPKHSDLVDLASIPSYAWIYCWDDLTIIYTESALTISVGSLIRKVQSLCWGCAETLITSVNTTKQGNLVLAKVEASGLEAVKEKIINRFNDDTDNRFYNHEFTGKVSIIIRKVYTHNGGFIYLHSEMPFEVKSPDHESITLDAGSWVGYHPRPTDRVD